MRKILLILLIIPCASWAQDSILVSGNYTSICLGNRKIVNTDTLPRHLDKYIAIMIFSGSTSVLNLNEAERLVQYCKQGGRLYIGIEDWPFQAEANQLTAMIYSKESYGTYSSSEAHRNKAEGSIIQSILDTFPAGSSSVAFPMDYRLKVEAWIEDQPLILSGCLEKGRILIDGGYSRFYCDRRNEKTEILLDQFFVFLEGD